MLRSRFQRAATGILVLAAVLRLIALGRGELWHDEFCSLLMLADPHGVLAAAASSSTTPDGGNPPLYYLLLAAWTGVFGLSAPAVRSLSLVASVAQVWATGGIVRAIGGGRGATLIAMAIAAVASLSVFYGTEARAYALLLLLLTLAVWTFFRALRRGRPVDWALHGVALLAAWYTHNLALPFTGALWAAVVVLRPGRRAVVALAGTHAAALALYSPWIPVLLAQSAQSGSGTHLWIRTWWERTPAWRLIPWSLEALGVAGPPPEYLDVPPVAAAARWASASLTLAAVAGAFAIPSPRRAGSAESGTSRRTLAALAVLVLFPLAFLLAYSELKAPLYLVGRYDLPAQVGLVPLIGIGIARLGGRFGRTGVLALAVAAAGATLGADGPRLLHPALRPAVRDKADRAAILAAHVEPNDLVICTGFLASETLAQMFREGMRRDVVTFPPDVRSHVGWYNPGEELARGEDALRAQAAELVREARARPRAWLVSQSGAANGPHGRILAILQKAMEDAGCRALYPPGEADRWRALGVCALDCPAGSGP